MPALISNESGISKCPMAKIEDKSNKIIAFVKKQVNKIYKNQPVQRAFHAKTIGLVAARLTIDANVEPNLNTGLFRKPGDYQAWVRFTNGDSRPGPDSKKQLRGMAIKIPLREGKPARFAGVDTPSQWNEDDNKNAQDIIMINSPMFVPSACSLIFSGARVALLKGIGRFIFAVPIFLWYRLKAFAFLRHRNTVDNVLEEAYYSCSPYKFGEDRRIKWAVRPLKTVITTDALSADDSYLRTQLIQDLSPFPERITKFELLVQFQENEETEPLEKTEIIWKTKFYQVAKLHIPLQNIHSDEIVAFDKCLFFSPGYTLPEHKPVGDLNLIRERVYEAAATARVNMLNLHSPT